MCSQGQLSLSLADLTLPLSVTSTGRHPTAPEERGSHRGLGLPLLASWSLGLGSSALPVTCVCVACKQLGREEKEELALVY